jgi:hypothetical protein
MYIPLKIPFHCFGRDSEALNSDGRSNDSATSEEFILARVFHSYFQ